MLPDGGPSLSFVNLLECHILNVLRTQYQLRVANIRRALETLERLYPLTKHPLIELGLHTDNVNNCQDIATRLACSIYRAAVRARLDF
jgi:hypothetical protein